MKSLLDQFIKPHTGFAPCTAAEFFALRLAQKLGDADGIRHYLQVANGYTEGQLLCAYRRCLRVHGKTDLWRRFHQALERIQGNGNGHHDGQSTLLSIRVERRTIAAAVFQGRQLEYTDSRQLSSTRDKAVGSAANFVGWLLDQFPIESVALESIAQGDEIQRRALHDQVCALIRERYLPIWEVPRKVLLEGCAYPAMRSRTQLREIATTIWPILAGTRAKPFIQDAAVLGLHVQTERLFIINFDNP